MTSREGTNETVAPPDPWEANRDRQLERWASQPRSHRVAWLEEAVDAAFRSGALPRRPTDGLPLPPLDGPNELRDRAEQARLRALSRLSDHFRGPCPPDVDGMRFAEIAVLVQFALWKVTDASFWCEHAQASPRELTALAARNNARLTALLR